MWQKTHLLHLFSINLFITCLSIRIRGYARYLTSCNDLFFRWSWKRSVKSMRITSITHHWTVWEWTELFRSLILLSQCFGSFLTWPLAMGHIMVKRGVRAPITSWVSFKMPRSYQTFTSPCHSTTAKGALKITRRCLCRPRLPDSKVELLASPQSGQIYCAHLENLPALIDLGVLMVIYPTFSAGSGGKVRGM